MTPLANPLQIVRGACGHDCPDTCSWVVEVRDGTAERLSGDPEHPFTRGTLCAKVNHYLERVYHPDRVLYPLKRAGSKGEGRFVRVSWDEALADIASRWQAIAAESGAEAILPYSSAGVQGIIQEASLDRRLFGSMGCSGLDRNICGAVAAAGLSATIGCGTGIDPEQVVHSRFIVLWGTNTIVTNLHFWPLVLEAQRRGAKIVAVDPIRTRTADAADWHIQIKPASDAALALAMMHVMIRDGLVDHDYVSQHAVGYEALAERVQQYSPAQVSHTVGLPAEEIERFAREYATTQPSLLRPLIGVEHHRNGAMQFRTLACLAVLSGSWRHRGGGLARSTHALHFGVLDMDRVLMPEQYKPGARVLNMRDLGDDLCSRELQPRLRSLIVYGSNPMVSMPNRGRIREGLLREDLFTVVHDLFVTDTALYADYVLPATSQIEHLDLSPAWGHLYLALNRPAIAPRGEAVANTELFRRLARALGRTEDWLFESDESMLRAALASGHPVARGDHVRAAVGTGVCAVELSGGLAAVRGRRLPDAVGEGGALFRAAPGARPRPFAVGRRDPFKRRASAHHRQDPALPEFRLQQHGAPPTPHGRVVHRDPRRRCTVAGRGDWRCGARLERSRRGSSRVLDLGPRAPGRRLDAVRRPGGCQWCAAIRERAHARRADGLGRWQRLLRRVRGSGAGRGCGRVSDACLTSQRASHERTMSFVSEPRACVEKAPGSARFAVLRVGCRRRSSRRRTGTTCGSRTWLRASRP